VIGAHCSQQWFAGGGFMEARDISPSPSEPFQISLRIRHPSIDPALISSELKVEPEHSFKAGEPRESSSGSALTSLHAESYWLGTLTNLASVTPLAGFSGQRTRVARDRIQAAMMMSLTVALDASVVAFLRQHGEFIRRLESEEAQVTLLIELSIQSLSGFTLSPQFTKALSELGIAVEFDFVTS
jgi:hypothetical protein